MSDFADAQLEVEVEGAATLKKRPMLFAASTLGGSGQKGHQERVSEIFL